MARLVILLAAISGLLGVVALAADPSPKPLTPAQVESFLRQLGDEDYQTREAATAALKRRPEAALALLRAERRAHDPEVKQRLATILPVMMNPNAAERRLARLSEYAERHQLDRFVETLVECREFANDGQREIIARYCKAIFDASAGTTAIVKPSGLVVNDQAQRPSRNWAFQWPGVELILGA